MTSWHLVKTLKCWKTDFFWIPLPEISLYVYFQYHNSITLLDIKFDSILLVFDQIW